MLIRCWGARGSIPVSGPEYLKYGGDTTCIEIRTRGGDIVIIDAGSGIRRLGGMLMREGQKTFSLLFTHAHWDHLLGFPFFKPIYCESTRITIYGCAYMEDSVKSIISPTMKPPNFPVHYEDISARIAYHDSCGTNFKIGSLQIFSIPLSHPNQGVGYKFVEDGRSMVFLTDNELGHRHEGGLGPDDYADFSKGADLLIHDAEYSRDVYRERITWGHSSYEDALALAIRAGVKKLGLIHHNQESSDDKIDSFMEDCGRLIRESGAALSCFPLYQGWELEL
ncbi:MAG: MBL fold metallo-hydrolase [Smithellaceae bacterium]|nr:MBL fold metallo-hydrolase [Smithellaceae bacterium]